MGWFGLSLAHSHQQPGDETMATGRGELLPAWQPKTKAG
jgi:hypothetical protein